MYNDEGDLTLLFDDDGQLSSQSNGNVVPISPNFPPAVQYRHGHTHGIPAPDSSEAPE
jgi:hypothetical protein